MARKRNQRWLAISARIRTVGFLMAMIPMVGVVTLLCLLSLVLISPLMVYAIVRGKHLKDPWKKPQLSLE